MSEIINETINELNKPTQNNVFSIEDNPVTVLEKINQVERYLKQIDTRVDTSINTANDALEKKMCEVPSLQGMGSTFVAVLINKDSAFIAHAGDSRCYLLRGNKCVYRSQDHSLVGELVRKKALKQKTPLSKLESNRPIL